MQQPFFALLLGLFLVCAPLVHLQAQAVAPWFRGSKQAWEALLSKTASPAAMQAKMATVLSQQIPQFSVKTTPHNWLLHRLGHSGVFSRVEKELLLQKKQTEKTLLGKLVYLHDRDSRLFTALSAQPGAAANEAAFWRHQNLLENTLAELENYYAHTFARLFTTPLFNEENVSRLLADSQQPKAFALYPKEVEHFAALETLSQQVAWAEQALRHTQADLNALLSKRTEELKPFEFERYYLQKIRLEYFLTLKEVLAKSTENRNSLIIRRKRVLKIDLPGAQRPMTDAQRLGFLRYHLARLNTPRLDFDASGKSDFEKYAEVKTVLAKLTPVYEPYAIGEAFGVPYEKVLKQGSLWPDFIVGPQEGSRLRALNGEGRRMELPAKIDKLERKLRAMLQQTPDGADFFVRYYRLEREKVLYDNFLLRERLLRSFK